VADFAITWIALLEIDSVGSGFRNHVETLREGEKEIG
jgi:hypothetical protein